MALLRKTLTCPQIHHRPLAGMVLANAWWLGLTPAYAMPSLDREELATHDAAWTEALGTRWRVDQPDMPGSAASSATASVFLGPKPEGVVSTPEHLPELDGPSGYHAGRYDPFEAIEALNLAPWREAGFDGSGVKVAVFDIQWAEWELASAELGDVETHDCFNHRSCDLPIDGLRPKFSYTAGSHGIGCAELIRDLAPGVELHLVSVTGSTSLENAVDWAIRNEIDLVSMSLSFFNESFYDGTGPLDEQMDRLAAADVLMVKSAGNYANEHWRGSFEDRDYDHVMEFGPNSERLEASWSAGQRRLMLSWDEYGRCGETDLDAYVYNEHGILVGRGEDPQDPEDDSCSPNESVAVNASEDGTYEIVVVRRKGAGSLEVDLYARNGDLVDPIPEGSITDPGANGGIFVIGAVRAEDYLANRAEPFSSWGNPDQGIPKPDIAAPDGVSGLAYGEKGFYGTSAATPAFVGALAVYMSAHPELRPIEAAQRLKDAAWSPRRVGSAFDPALGAGHARLPPLDSQAPGCGTARLFPMVFLPFGLAFARGPRRRRAAGCRLREPRTTGPDLPAFPAAPPQE